MADINLGVGGANSAVAGGYDIANSLKFEPDNSESMSRTPSSNGNLKTCTLSVWLKRTELKDGFYFSGDYGTVYPDSWFILGFVGDRIYFSTTAGISSAGEVRPNRVFRDTSAWYHIVVACDTTQSTAADRVKMYVNGVQETSFLVANYPNQNDDLDIMAAKAQGIGGYNDGVDYFYSGYMSEFVGIDGQQLDPTSFGEFDSDSGIWIPKDVSDLTFGTNGFYLDFEDSSNLGNDASGGTDFAETNITAADQATDTPTNNFTTWNTIRYFNQGVISFKEGGTVLSNSFNGGFSAANNNIRMGKGKWYAEFEVTVSGNYLMNGNVDADYIDNSINAAFYLGSLADKTAGAGYYSSGTTGDDTIYYEATFTSSGVTTSAGDIISVAIDCDNNKVHFAVNGSWTNSSDPATNTNGFAMTDNEQYFALASIGVRDYKANFGGYTTSTISSPASDANGYGTFEYAPPSGYYALCTKNLAEYG